jgi:hypothetical protein
MSENYRLVTIRLLLILAMKPTGIMILLYGAGGEPGRG